MKIKGKNRLSWFVVLLLMLPYISYLVQGGSVLADDTNNDTHSLFKNQLGDGQVSFQTEKDRIHWTVKLNQAATPAATTFQLLLKEEKQDKPLEVSKLTGTKAELIFDKNKGILEKKSSAVARTNEVTFDTEKKDKVTLETKIVGTVADEEVNQLSDVKSLLIDTATGQVTETTRTSEESSASAEGTTSPESTVDDSASTPATSSSATASSNTPATEGTTSTKTDDSSTTSKSSGTKEKNDSSVTSESSSIKSAKESNKDKVDLGEADDATFKEAKKAAEQRQKETGKAQEITRSAAANVQAPSTADTKDSNALDVDSLVPDYHYGKFTYTNNTSETANPKGFLNSFPLISGNTGNYNYGKVEGDPNEEMKVKEKDASNKDAYLDYLEHGGDVDIDGKLHKASVQLHKDIKEIAQEQGAFDITLKVRGSSYVPKIPINVVFVIDTSYSMRQTPAGDKQSKMDSAKSAAKDFVKGVLEDNEQNRVSIVTFGNNARVASSNKSTTFDSSKAKIFSTVADADTFIDSLSADENTATQSGIALGQQVMDKMNAESTEKKTKAKPIMVLLTDGAPTRAWSTSGFTYIPKSDSNYSMMDPHNGELLNADYASIDVKNTPNKGMSHELFPSVNDANKNNTPYGTNNYGYQRFQVTNGTTVDWVNDFRWPTLSTAYSIKQTGTEIYTLGFALPENGETTTIKLDKGGSYTTKTTNEQATYFMKKLASGEDHYYPAANKDQITEQLKSIAGNLNSSVRNATLEDNIDSQLFTFDKTKAVRSVKIIDSKDVSNSVEIPLFDKEKPQQTYYQIEGNQIKVTGFSLGDSQRLEVVYRVHINTERSDFVPEQFYRTNMENQPATLQPIGTRSEKLNFPIVSAKAPGVKLDITKKWQGDKEHKVDRKDLSFTVTRDHQTDSTFSLNGLLKPEKGTTNDSWDSGEFEQVAQGQANVWLPKFNNQGEDFTYKVLESDDNSPLYESKDVNDPQKNPYKFDFVNTRKVFSLKLTKVDQDNPGTKLPGATFTITGGKLPNEEPLTTLTDTDKSGLYQLPANVYLEKGKTYTLTETKAPDGYQHLGHKITIKIADDGQVELTDPSIVDKSLKVDSVSHVISFELTNKAKVPLPSTGGPGALLYTLAGFSSLVAVGGYFWYRRSRKEVA